MPENSIDLDALFDMLNIVQREAVLNERQDDRPVEENPFDFSDLDLFDLGYSINEIPIDQS